MMILFIFYFCRINSILLMFLGLLIGSFSTLFILREFYCHPQFRTSLNLLIITIFLTDCIRGLICVPLETFVLIKSWNKSIVDCDEQDYFIEYNPLLINFCRINLAVRSCFNVTQPLSFIAIAYERLRTIVNKNGILNLTLGHHQQRDFVRIKHVIIWISGSFILGILAAIYQAIAYFPSNTCYGQSDIASRVAMIIRLICVLGSALISGFIYAKIFCVVKKYQYNRVIPTISNTPSAENPNNLVNDARRKDYRSAKQSFNIFLSFFLCRLPSVITILLGLIIKSQLSKFDQCYLEEFTNLSVQCVFISMSTDPLTYIWSQPKLKIDFSRLSILSLCFRHRIEG